MFKVQPWIISSFFVVFSWFSKEFVCAFEVVYEGSKFVSEGSDFRISCLKSSYSIPKWTKDGVNVDTLSPDFSVLEEGLPDGKMRMELTVKRATWRSRGHYKCDKLSEKSHSVEVVPLKESDAAMLRQNRIELRPKRTLKLVCDQDENAVFPINWYKDGKRILESEDDPRIRMEGQILWISKSRESDSGEYVCRVEMSGLSYPFAPHLGAHTKVTYSPRVEKFAPQIRPILNRNLNLECKVEGFPAPRVSWFVDNFSIEEYRVNDSRYDAVDNHEGLPNAVFVIRDVEHDDNHVVTCIAENMEGSARTSTLLAVRESAIVTNEEFQGSGLNLTPGEDLVLQCNNTDRPSAKVKWFKNGAAVNFTGSHIVEDSPTNSLIIKNALDSDCGNYTCTADNQEAIIAVRSIVKLGHLESSRNVVQNQNIILVCNVTQGYPKPTIQWLKDNEPLNVSDPRVSLEPEAGGIEGSKLKIADARFEDRAEYTCIAANDYTSDNKTILVRVKDKYAALWPFLGICAEVAVLCTIIFIYEKRRQKPDFDESENEPNTENKSVADQEDKNRDVRQRK